MCSGYVSQILIHLFDLVQVFHYLFLFGYLNWRKALPSTNLRFPSLSLEVLCILLSVLEDLLH